MSLELIAQPVVPLTLRSLELGRCCVGLLSELRRVLQGPPKPDWAHCTLRQWRRNSALLIALHEQRED